ncbi:TonB-dependent siderophore receptor [Sinomicrobium soli]|uniref:TonB-dependent siderophore receptor n=1 Tax=Sinomicrobium sp. N-1-3-6 TaxID=2219864 RepID=UPI000DCDD507|nr:TonB-dependent siderophore receptor [Sinomicrobium sp. N-1-3-6]RAV29988.1 TonB-dependent siderophore receptor [Sinomicrobium sp. N-1-3-6]
MINKIFCCSFLYFSLIFGLQAQNGTASVSGNITDQNGEPLAAINVILKGTGLGASTDNSGNFVIKKVPFGNYTLIASSIGFKKQVLSVSVSGDTRTDIALEETVSELKDVTISGRRKESYTAREVSSSLRLGRDPVKIPQNIQVISEDVLKDQQSFTMMEAITRNVSGAQMIEHWGWFSRINMRGFKIPAFRNGMNVEMTWGPLAEDMSMVERIEFVKGPAGFMLAAGEPGGFYNVVTKKPKKEHIAEVNFTTGSFNTYRGAVDLGSYAAGGKLQFRLNAMAQTQETNRDYDRSSRFSVVPSVKYEFSDNTSVTTEFTWQKARMKAGSAYVFAPISIGYGGLDRDFTAMDPDYPDMDIDEYSTFTNFTHKFNDNWTFQAQYMHMRYEQEGVTLWPAGEVQQNGDMIRSVTSADALGRYHIAQFFVNGNFETGSVTHKILAGFDFNEKQYWADWNQGGAIDTEERPFNVLDPHYGDVEMPVFDRSVDIKIRGASNGIGMTTKGFYVQDELGFLEDRLRLSLAGRYTLADIYAYGVPADGSEFTPRIGVSYDVMPDLTVYGLFDQSFYPQQGVKYPGEPLSPNKSSDLEAGIKKSWFEDRLRTSLTAYRINKDNMSVTDYENGVPATTDTNGDGVIDENDGMSYPYSIEIGEVVSKGVEFDMQGKITPELNVILNYAFTEVKDKDNNRIAGHARHITNGWLNYAFKPSSALKGFGASVGYQYQVDRSSWNWGADSKSELPDYFRMDGGIFWSDDHFDVRLNINNLLNEYLYSGSNYGTYVYWQAEPGRNFRLSLNYRF